MKLQERYDNIINWFRREMPTADTELEFGSVFQLLVAVVLSAQCTDKRVNMVTPALFARYPTAHAMAQADVEEVYDYVKSVSYPNAKAGYLVAMARMIEEEFGGEVPSQMSDMLRLPGVGRKTANVLQAVWFGKATMAVDTHVYRVSHRLGLVPPSANTPLKVERELMRNIPTDDVPNAHHWLLLHGRYVCKSGKPACATCPFDSFCPKRLANSKLRA